MIKRIFCALLILVLVIPSAITVSAVTSYALYVGGVQVTDENAADVLGDGTVSYDSATNTLTLNNARINDYYTLAVGAQNGAENSYHGIYCDIPDLTVNLVGENRIVTKPDPNEEYYENEIAVYSPYDLVISGSGKLSVTSTTAVGSLQSVTVKDCTVDCSYMGIMSFGDTLINGATVSATVNLISSRSGDITLKNTTVPNGGNYMGIHTLMGDITIEGSNIKIHTAVSDEFDTTNSIMLGDGGGTLTVKDSVLDLKGGMFAIMSSAGKGIFENVSGSIVASADSAAYGMYFGSSVNMKGCDLEFSCMAEDDSAGGISAMGAVTVENSNLKIESRSAGETAMCIYTTSDLSFSDSTLTASVSGPFAFCLNGANVKLDNSLTVIEATAIMVGSNGISAGIYTESGSVRINGGAFDATATGPVIQNATPSTAILMGNAVLAPVFIGADIKLRGNAALSNYPDLTIYGREYELKASTDITGNTPAEFNADTLASLRYLHIHPFYKISFSGNGLTGTMADVTDVYGSFTLPENGFTLPERTVFKGWSLSADGEILTETSIVPHADTVLYAIWEELPSDPVHVHSFGEDWKSDGKTHYKECECGEKTLVSAHVDKNENGSCDICLAACEDEGIGAGVIALIVIGSVAVLGGGGFCVYWFVIKKKLTPKS